MCRKSPLLAPDGDGAAQARQSVTDYRGESLMLGYDSDDFQDVMLDDGRVWRTCWQCAGELFVDHDCGEDVCCCAFPEDNVTCDLCDGDGGWYLSETKENRDENSDV